MRVESAVKSIAGYIDTITEPRRTRVLHYCDVISQVVPDLQKSYWEYGGGLIGFGRYRYRYATGREGEWFMLGVGNRKRYIALYSNAAPDGRYLVEAFESQLNECKIGKCCIEIPDGVELDGAVVLSLAQQTLAYFQDEMTKPPRKGVMQITEC